MNILTKQFIETVYDDGDWTCLGPYYENKTFPVSTLKLENSEYVSINAMTKKTTRKITNVTKLRTFLFEMDSDVNGNPISMKEQIRLIKDAGLPWSTMTSSASKSIHFLLVLDQPLADRPIYTAYFEAVRAALLTRGILIDKACKDPSRFTRAPFGTNTKADLVTKKPDATTRTQTCLRVNGRHKRAAIDAWLETYNIRVDDYLKIPTDRPVSSGQTSAATVGWKFDVIAKNFMGDDKCVQGNINNYQHKMAWLLFGAGCTRSEIETVFSQKFEAIDHRDPISSAEKASVKCDPIYISTEAEQKEYYKKQDAERVRATNRTSYDRELPPEVKENLEAENINLYLTIGTEYYKINPVDRSLIQWSKTMFEKLYGSMMIPPVAYNLKGYRPDYLSKQFPMDLAADRKTRNMFQRPTYSIKPGNWDTIKQALEHGFEEQYDLILQYCAIMIAFPEAKLPNLWFVGPEDKGKSAVVAIFKYLVGIKNTNKVGNSILESGFDSFLAESQLTVVEEAGNWKEPQVVMDKIKDWTTETMEITVNPKYGKQYLTPIHSKFIFTSNGYDSIPLVGKATRFWIRSITKSPKHRVANYYERVEQEMGHFVDYLIEEVVPHLRQDRRGNLDTTNRLYFAPEEYETEVKAFVKGINKSLCYEAIMETCSRFFELFPEESECWFNIQSIKDANDWKYKTSPNNKEIKMTMKNEFDIEMTKRLVRPDSLKWVGNDPLLRPTGFANWFLLTRDQVIGDALFSMPV
tara:strand:+ start:798 stop:3044 length:2247 start_codon:yes stop_codon:yes gene_type:complete